MFIVRSLGLLLRLIGTTGKLKILKIPVGSSGGIWLDRLMFGSDWPVCLLAGSYQHVVKIIDLFIEELSPDKQNKIMGENAINFYKL